MKILITCALLLIISSLSAPVRAQTCSSNGTNADVTLDFENYRTDSVSLFWINYSCQEQFYTEIAAGMTMSQPTYDGHEWVIRAANGDEITRVTASTSGDPVVIIGEPFAAPTSPLDFTYRPEALRTVADFDPTKGCVVRPVTPADDLDPFYAIMCDYAGIPITSSARVPEAALQAAWGVVAVMLDAHPQVVEQMLEHDLIIGIVAEDEGITDLPEYAFLRDDPNMDWNARSRGFGGNVQVPLMSGAEENVLCYPTDPYLGENIFVHEFAHTMKDMGIALVDPQFNAALDLAYQAATAEGLWADTYAISTLEEYWAEGVQDYFNTNLEAIPTNGIHNTINTRDELAEYDPTLYAIIDTVYGGLEWTPTCP